MLLVVQIHICQANYILPGGEVCEVCPKIAACDTSADAYVLTSSDHGDCHDCCQLQACDDSSSVKAPVASAPILSLDLDIPFLPAISIQTVEIETLTTHFFLEGAPPTGPPSPHRSRAPPFQLN